MRRWLTGAAAATVLAAALPGMAGAATSDESAEIDGAAAYTDDREVTVDVEAKACGGNDAYQMGDVTVRAGHSALTDLTPSGFNNWAGSSPLSLSWTHASGNGVCAAGPPATSSFAWELEDLDGTRHVHLAFLHQGTVRVTTEVASIVLDTTPPDVAILAPEDGATPVEAAVTVMGTAGDATSGVKKVTVTVGGGPDIPTTLGAPVEGIHNWTTEAGAVELDCGVETTITAEAEDSAGNTETDAVTVTRDCSSSLDPVGNGHEHWKDAPAVANALINAGEVDCTGLSSGRGNNWRGKAVSGIAHWAEAVDKADADEYPDEAAWTEAVRGALLALSCNVA